MGALPRSAIGGISFHLFHVGEGDECGVPVFLVDGEDVLVLPVVVAVCFQRIGLHLYIRFYQQPLLIGLVGVRLHLGDRFAYRARTGKSQIISARHARKRVVPVGLLCDSPLLVGIVGVAVPLNDVSLHSSAPSVVDGLLGEGADDAVDVLLYRNELPYL